MRIIETNLIFKDSRKETKYHVIHHSASNPATTTMKIIHGWHLANGWAGCGYHFGICSEGNIYRGRPLMAVGAHCRPRNRDSIGTVLFLNGEIEAPTSKQLKTLEMLHRYLISEFPDIILTYHGKEDATACPGKYVIEKLKESDMFKRAYNKLKEKVSLNSVLELVMKAEGIYAEYTDKKYGDEKRQYVLKALLPLIPVHKFSFLTRRLEEMLLEVIIETIVFTFNKGVGKVPQG